ncbi:unnamed protein product [Caenorhabditis bovis]|uniref:Cation-transporting P-type ATPase C-terminal domain-containing protein n=1 Tax=Caenorhabditis bovis TaxID=2654633 RepID=A0A8S1F5D1_9PELO|nr:unnamed protein product [Caenorhabditis bovis]
MEKWPGLTSHQAFEHLIQEAKLSIAEWYSVNVVNKIKPVETDKVRKHGRFFCKRTFAIIRLALLFLIIGAVDIDNRISLEICTIYVLIFIYTILLQIWQTRLRENLKQFKFRAALEEIERIEEEKPNEFVYPSNLEAVTDDVALCQTAIRDGRIVEVPTILLVVGDVILLRPGKPAPCACETIDGKYIAEGEQPTWLIKPDPKTNVVEPLEPVYARVVTYPIKTRLEATLSNEESLLLFDHQVHYLIHYVFERILLPFTILVSILGTTVRFLYADYESLFGTRFVFAVPALTIFPMLIIQLPFLLHSVKCLNNRTIFEYLNLDTKTFRTSKDLLAILAGITGTSFVDKKGILSSAHPSIEKLVFATNECEKETGSLDSEQIHLDVVNLSSDQRPDDPSKWELSFDDNTWQKYVTNLLPLAHNLLLNSCKQSEEFHRFLDHLSVVSQEVPRTIATANRRCMCQLPALMGFTEKSLEQFSNPTILGIYKRQPGEAPLPGLTKHRTPVEMAFCTIHNDNQSIYRHLACQGTANLVVDGCTHIWNGANVVPLSKRITSSVKDFYQRHSMTGHCLAVSYRPIFGKIDEKIAGKYVEVPLNHEVPILITSLARSHSIDSLQTLDKEQSQPISTADDAIERCFDGNVLCGLVVLHYEAITSAVSVIEKLDGICVRPVYFSKENELRSRVFAEKLGIEAGWNCHISLADDEDCTTKTDVSYKQFVEQIPCKTKFWGRMAISESHLENWDAEKLTRSTPSIRKFSTSSGKMGPIPNIARLPTGVKNVRPHLENVDNVPLLVGLFTDSTTSAVEEMIDILQENGEIVMVVGSSRNLNNTMLFAKANISVSIDHVEEASCRVDRAQNKLSNVNSISSKLISIATDFRLKHDGLLRLPSLIACARHRMSSYRSSLLFLLHSSLLVTLVMLLSTLAFLPIIFTHYQILLTSLIHIPALFIGTMFTDFEPSRTVIRIAPKNCIEIPKAEKIATITTFVLQFAPSAVYLNFVFLFMLVSNSNMMCSFSDISCILNSDGTIGARQLEFNETIDYTSLSTDTIRHVMGFQLTTCLVVLSSAFVFGLSSFWEDVPFKCVSWNASTIICLVSQIVFSAARGVHLSHLFDPTPLAFLTVWIVFIGLVNELNKIRRIRMFSREQRRTKFDFDTKLGMNSPY